ncbi:MAG: hypothetical protein IJL87_10465 [Clostridia bacterium]|nr:hypothetical protein [Clostridia bacterium]
MFDYKTYFDRFCKEEKLDLRLSFDMPPGYEAAYGTFDAQTKTVCINAKLLEGEPDFEKAFYLFHELRHALQYLCSWQFDDALIRSAQYTIMYDGACYKLVNGKYLECKLEGGEEYFANIYAGQPYEVDANNYAYERARKIFGDLEKLRKLHEFWMPRQPVSEKLYDSIFALIDKNAK